jgi:hypothetical protein
MTMKNPAAVYCTDLGYEYETVTYADGSQNGVCHLPDGSTCSAWAFLRGQCGPEHSICARHGLATEVRSDGGNAFSSVYAACVERTGRERGPATEMAGLMARTVGADPRAPFGIRRYGPESVQVPPLSDTAVSDLVPADLPPAFDWRNHQGENWVTPVKDQGMCGSCWAFGAVGAVEATYNIDADNPQLDLDLSEQYLVTDCSWAGACRGGWFVQAITYIQLQGIPDEGCLPYRDGGPDGCTYLPECSSICTYSGDGECSDYRCSDRCATWEQRLQTIQDYIWVDTGKTAIKEALIEHGPLAVHVSSRGWFDPDGIYRCEDNEFTSHVVVLVGYENSAGGYWILKNSGGVDYEDGGFYRVAYDTCGVQTLPIAIDTGLDQPGVTLSPPGGTGRGEPGTTVTYDGWLFNHTGITDRFDLALSGGSWPAHLPVSHIDSLADGESIRFSVHVTIPAHGVVDGDSDAVTITAVGSASAHQDTSTFVTEANVPPRIEVSPAMLNSVQAPGTSVFQALVLDNPSSSTFTFSIHQALPTDAALLLSLNETGSPELFLDGSGMGRHGTCMAASCPQAGVWSPRGRAALFDGVNDRVVTPLVLDQSAESPGATMMAWVRPTGTNTEIQQVISSDDGGHDWSLMSWGGFWHVASGSGSQNTGLSVNLNQWQHVAAVFEPSLGRIRFYKNGVEVVIPSIGYDTSVNPVVLGDNAGSWEQFFEGRIDEVRVYEHTLSAEQIRDIYRGSAQADWLSWDVPYGRVFGLEQRAIQFALDASGLQPDIYRALVSVLSTDPDRPRVDVPVAMAVADQAPLLVVRPAVFDETLAEGASLTRTLTISNAGTGDLTFEMSTLGGAAAPGGVQVQDASWLTLSPASGTVHPGQEAAIQVTFDAAGLAPGAHSACVRVESNDLLSPTLDVPVSLTVTEAIREGTVQGTVTDKDTGAPLAATVSVVGETESTTTDAGGAYALTLEAGAYTLHVEAAGYVSETAGVTVVAGQATTQDFALSPETRSLYLPLVIR